MSITIRQLFSLLRKGLIGIIGLYGLVMMVGAALYFLAAPHTTLIELIKALFAVSLWLSVPLFLLAAVLRGWRVSIVMGAVVLIFAIVYVPYLIPRVPEVPADAPRLSVMTFNLMKTSDQVAEVIREANVDVVALQELSFEGAAALEGLNDIYPYFALHPQPIDYVGQGILSRYPILDDAYWEYPELPETLGHQRVEIDFEGTQVIIYNTHPWPPLDWADGYNDESHRLALLDVAERAFAEEGPLLLVGDFNMTDVFEEYRLLASRYTDSYRTAGDGIGYTYPNYRYAPVPAVLRLDYVWHSAHFTSVEARVLPDHGLSDHSPVVAELVLAVSSS